MDDSKRKEAKSKAVQRKMGTAMSEGGTKGSFTASASKAGHPDTPAGLSKYASEVLSDPSASPKLKKKANFYRNVASK